MALVDDAVAAIQSGRAVVLPTDTVYGLCTTPYSDEPARRLYRLKGRDEQQPSALLACDLEYLLECVPELRGRAAVVARALLPGPYTLVLPNPSRRYRWLTGSNPTAIGVRVPVLEGDAKAVVERVGAIVATSANRAGGPDPRRVDEVPEEILEGCAVVVEGGELLGVPSTVIDFTGDEPRILREGAGPIEPALELAAASVL